MITSRRSFLKCSGGMVAAASLSGLSRLGIRANAAPIDEKHYTIVNVTRTTVKLEYREVPRRNMDRELPHWRYAELCQVELSSGHTGVGETMLYYTWGVPSDADVKRVIGKNAIDVMWDDSLGAGLQMAAFDAVGRTAEVPVHSLLGPQIHDETPLSWWNIDTSADDMALECQQAKRLGYMSYKTKGRPWFDVDEQLKSASRGLPDAFKIDMDFNETLRDAKRGLPILKRLEKYPQVDIYETPIPQSDVEGNRAIVDQTRVHLAMHYGKPEPRVVVESGCCDGFVVGGGASQVIGAGRFCEQVEMPFWLQLVGAGLTAAYSLHFGGVLEQARWPAVNCHQLFEKDLLQQPIVVTNGSAQVPDHPGIGYEVDWDLVETIRVAKPTSRPEPERLIETTWSDGKRMYTASNGKVNFMLDAGNEERYPYYAKGADTKLVPNDGSQRWKDLYRKASSAGPIAG